MPQLDPTWFASQIFWLAVCFTLLYVVLARVVLPPLSGTIARRGQTIDDDLSAAENAKSLAERARQDYDHTLAQSREMAHALINEVLAENKKHAEQTMAALDKEIAAKLKEAAVRIAAKKHDLLSSLTPAAAEFAAMIAEKVTQKPVSADQASSTVMDMLKNKEAA